jgi:hypothetical protein
VTAANAGAHAVTAKVCDQFNDCAEQSFTVVVNQVPVVDAGVPAQTCTQYQPCSFSLPANAFNDPDGEDLTMTVAETAPTPGALTGVTTPLAFVDPTFTTGGATHYSTAGSYTYSVTGTDKNGASDTTTFTVTVVANSAPVNGALTN